MSRIGKKPIPIPQGVKVAIKDNKVSVEGPKGSLEYAAWPDYKIEISDNAIKVSRPSDSKSHKSGHGLIRAILNNMIRGVKDGYSKELEIRGTGFKAQALGRVLKLTLGYTHPIDYNLPVGITAETPKPTQIVIKGADRALLGEVASEIRGYYEPEPYKGKGIRYLNEYVRHKAGKTVA